MNDLKRGLQQIYAWTVQQQLTLGLLIFIAIALLSQLLLHWFAPAALIWLCVSIITVGLLFGLQLALLSVVYPVVVLSPWYQQLPLTGNAFFTWLSQLIGLALIAWAAGEAGGLLKQHLYRDEENAANGKGGSSSLTDVDAIAKRLARLLRDQKGSLDKLDLLAVKLNNFDQVKSVAGAQTANSMVKKLADSLSATLGEHGHVSRTEKDQLIGFGDSGLSIEALEQKINEQLEAFAKHHPSYLDLKASTSVHQLDNEDEEHSPRAQVKQFVAHSKAMQQALNSDAKDSKLEQNLSKETIPKAKRVLAAITSHEISMYFQPRLNTASGYFNVLEAIPHWQHPKRGTLWLEDFADIITEAKQWNYFSQWMASQIVHDIELWIKKGFRFHLSLALPYEHHNCDAVLDYLYTSTPKAFITNGRLSLILSSLAYTELSEKSKDKLANLKQLGTQVIISEFGDGHLTVKSLRDDSVDGVKFASSVIEAAAHNSDQQRQLMTLMKMAKTNGLTTIASNIDSKQTLLMLKRLGCDELQGPILCHTVPTKQIPWSRFR